SAVTEVVSGAAFDVTVTALDAYGHIASGYLGTVTISSTDTDPGILLPADYTFTADDQGVHTFVAGCTLLTAGSQTLAASDTADSTISGSAAVTVDPGAVAPPGGRASRPVIPTSPTAGTPAQSVQRSQDVASVDRVFASHDLQESAGVERFFVA